MADALVSALANTILENLNSSFMKEIGLVWGLKTEFENLESTLTTIQAVLQDAEEKQWKSEAVKNWLGKLKHVVYNLEDVLEEFQTEAVRRTLHKDVRTQVSTFFSLQNPLLFRLNMARQFKNVREKLDAIAEERTKFHLREGVTEVEIQRKEDRETSSLVTESEVYGRKNEKEMIIRMLLENVSDSDDLSVHAICGMGGLGKTTMAQLVYNDENVRKAFDLRAWVCISDDFDIKKLTKAIVESIGGKSCKIQELDPLQRQLEEKLVGKRFLLVLDDVWNEYHDKWDRLKEAIRRGAKGSTVIVTTRIEKVALMMATVPVYRLGCLSDDDSWSLFKQRAFGMGRNEDKGSLETIGRQIVKKCGGVPLAIKAIGSIMCLKSQESEWLHVKDSNIWDLEEEGNRILAVLKLSYDHLPPYLRQCFLFCSIFPKDYVMEKQQLIELWMANGFIPSRGAMDVHEMGCKIFNELTWRSFFQEMKEDIDGTVTCKMHDLIHDVATSIMGHECCVIQSNKVLKIPKTARHLYVNERSSSERILVDIPKMQSLRSLILDGRFCHLPIPPHLSKQKYLKVLSWGVDGKSIPVDNLKHLRYLNLSYSRIRNLPESTSRLYNLQTLCLRRCNYLRMLPKGMKQLKNLRYLDIAYCDELTSMPVGLGHLSCLRMLTMFIVGKDNGRGIDQLKELALEGELNIKELYNVEGSAEAKNSNLIKKQNLRSLRLFWGERRRENSRPENDEEILNGLQPHSNLKKLHVCDYQGLRFPYWMMDLLLPNLVKITLENFEKCDQLPPLGKLCFLKELNIYGMGALKSIDSNFYGDGESSFPSLEILSICNAQCLEEWTAVNGRESFPLLSSLTIGNCPQLVNLPKLQSLKELLIREASVSLLKTAMMIATNLTSLRIEDFRELTELPDGLQNLSSLERLELYGCPSLVTLPVNGLQGLSSLSSLRIDGCEKLASLSEGVRYLSSLRSLQIWGCEGLISLPNEIEHLALLSELDIWYCSYLMSLPQGIRSLTALRTVSIVQCPQLKRRCEEGRGEDWPNIAHIPSIDIN
ncbi:hypothetical protein REPUB_Repub01dG0025000 [Reevesia pubescens]